MPRFYNGFIKMKTHRATIALMLCIYAGGLFWLWQQNAPKFYIWRVMSMEVGAGEDRTPQRVYYAKKLSSYGPVVVQPVIQALREHGPWGPRTYALVWALRDVGLPAHRQLISAVSTERDPVKRIFLIYALQEAFHDFSRINLWLNDVYRFPATENYLQRQLFNEFGNEVPAIESAKGWGNANSDFKKWYQKHSLPRGHLPIWVMAQ